MVCPGHGNSVIKRNEVLTHATIRVNFENMLSEKRPPVMCFGLYEIFRIGKPTEAESSVVPGARE